MIKITKQHAQEIYDAHKAFVTNVDGEPGGQRFANRFPTAEVYADFFGYTIVKEQENGTGTDACCSCQGCCQSAG